MRNMHLCDADEWGMRFLELCKSMFEISKANAILLDIQQIICCEVEEEM